MRLSRPARRRRGSSRWVQLQLARRTAAQGPELRRQREDDVEVPGGQEVLGPLGDPFLLCQRLALGTMPVATGVVRRMLVPEPVERALRLGDEAGADAGVAHRGHDAGDREPIRRDAAERREEDHFFGTRPQVFRQLQLDAAPSLAPQRNVKFKFATGAFT